MEANPDKVKAILDMSPPKTIKEVQRRMAALNLFLSKSAERGLPFFNKNEYLKWNDRFQQAFDELKGYLHSLPP